MPTALQCTDLLASAAYFLKKGSSGVRVMCSRSVPYIRASADTKATTLIAQDA